LIEYRIDETDADASMRALQLSLKESVHDPKKKVQLLIIVHGCFDDHQILSQAPLSLYIRNVIASGVSSFCKN